MLYAVGMVNDTGGHVCETGDFALRRGKWKLIVEAVRPNKPQEVGRQRPVSRYGSVMVPLSPLGGGGDDLCGRSSVVVLGPFWGGLVSGMRPDLSGIRMRPRHLRHG